MRAIEACRTPALGGHVETCDACGFTRNAYNSCRNRHCPKCQALAKAQWLAARKAELLPVTYFHTFYTSSTPQTISFNASGSPGHGSSLTPAERMRMMCELTSLGVRSRNDPAPRLARVYRIAELPRR